MVDEDDNVLQEGQGSLAVKKPHFLHWKTTEPEESLIVSDGSTLWVYDPFVEQASAYAIENSVANTPILLLTSTDDSLWQQYTVSQQNADSYLIHSNDESSRIKTLSLKFLPNSHHLKSFSMLDSTGQLSVITLENTNTQSNVDTTLFNFSLPEGAYLDDQR